MLNSSKFFSQGYDNFYNSLLAFFLVLHKTVYLHKSRGIQCANSSEMYITAPYF